MTVTNGMVCRDHTDIAIDDDLWRRLSTDKASCHRRNCHYYRECPFFVADVMRKYLQGSGDRGSVRILSNGGRWKVKPYFAEPASLLSYWIGSSSADVARDAGRWRGNYRTSRYRLRLDLFQQQTGGDLHGQFRPKTTPPLANPGDNAPIARRYTDDRLGSMPFLICTCRSAGGGAPFCNERDCLIKGHEICQLTAKLMKPRRRGAGGIAPTISEKPGHFGMPRIR